MNESVCVCEMGSETFEGEGEREKERVEISWLRESGSQLLGKTLGMCGGHTWLVVRKGGRGEEEIDTYLTKSNSQRVLVT